MSLVDYARKRDFEQTAEPAPVRKSRTKKRQCRFVIQKHAASRLHYDFRLEVNGVLKSWAVPKGIPFGKGEKHLAVQVEDHPLDYAGFEGVIPAGQYGGGTVMVWDTGHWEPLGGDPTRDLVEGKLHLALRGEKLNGEWTLVKIRGNEENQWLLLKSGESMRPVSRKRDGESAATGRTMRQIAAQRTAEWNSNHKTATRSSGAKSRKRGGRRPKFIEPMLCKLVQEPPPADGWLFELKHDGYRAIIIKDGNAIQVLSRNGKDLAKKFPDLRQALESISAERAVIDGEIVAVDDAGRSSFALLQAYELNERRPSLVFYGFDLLHHDGHDLCQQGLEKRREALKSLFRGDTDSTLQFSAEIVGDPRKILALVKKRGLEGIIGKRRDSRYEAGRRSGAWVKVKCLNEQEFVLAGFTPPKGGREHFGALLVGYFEKGRLLFAGKVGSGFTAKSLRDLHLKFRPLAQTECAFADLPEKKGSRWSQNLTVAEMRRCTWLKPQLVCQCRFTEWTRDGKLRHPVFVGLRDGHNPRKVVRESAA